MNGKKTKERFAFKDIAKSLRYTADWVELHQKNCDVVAETWQNKKGRVKFGFLAYCENGDQDEIALEDLEDADPG